MKFRIKNAMNGTYFRGMTGIGPAFGATWEDAEVFENGMVAYHVMKRFPLTCLADMVNENDIACTITGEPLDGKEAIDGA